MLIEEWVTQRCVCPKSQSSKFYGGQPDHGDDPGQSFQRRGDVSAPHLAHCSVMSWALAQTPDLLADGHHGVNDVGTRGMMDFMRWRLRRDLDWARTALD